MKYTYQLSPVPDVCINTDADASVSAAVRSRLRHMARTFPKPGMNMLYTVPYWLYRNLISPLRPACCRFYPTCSEYALLALLKYGPIDGSFLALWRILRCNPFSEGGCDQVP